MKRYVKCAQTYQDAVAGIANKSSLGRDLMKVFDKCFEAAFTIQDFAERCKKASSEIIESPHGLCEFLRDEFGLKPSLTCNRYAALVSAFMCMRGVAHTVYVGNAVRSNSKFKECDTSKLNSLTGNHIWVEHNGKEYETWAYGDADSIKLQKEAFASYVE